MTQPRKEQVKNLKTKYTRFNGVGNLALGGGPVQTVSNTGLEAFYDNLLAATKTGVVGGAETSAPAILYGGFGPFTLASGASMTLTIPGVASGAPMVVQVAPSDIVTLGGSPVVTTSRMADRINQAVFAFGVTAPVADNVNGQLIIKSVGTAGLLTGDSLVMTLSEVTAGMLNALGFTSLASITASGTTAPKRGLVTVSNDGLGGVVQLRKLDAVIADAAASTLRHTLAGTYVPEVAHGQPVFARLTAFPGPVVNGRNIRLSYFRNGPVRPRVVTSQGVAKSNFSTLTGGDTVAVAMNFGNGQLLNFNVTFSGITTVQGVVDKFNEALQTASLAATSSQVSSTVPTVIFKLGGPYRFSDPATKDSFFISFNGLTPVHVNPPAGIYSADELAQYIAGRIAAAGQSGQGQAFVYTDPSGAVFTAVRSLNSDVTASSVRVLPGSPGGGSPGQYMETLDMLGITPGTYRSGTCAQLYGNDEVELHCPSPLPGATLTVSGSSVTMTKLGLPAGVNVSSSVGIQPAVAPASHSLLPEMMEFHEERDDYDSLVQDFDNKSPFNQLRPQDGTANVGLDQLLGPDGKLSGSLIPRILGFLGAGQLNLGSGLINSLINSTLTPKVTAQHEWSGSGFYNLLFESSSDTGSSPSLNSIVRIYTLQGRVHITVNAKVTAAANAATPFARDKAADSFILKLDSGKVSLGVHGSADPAAWGESGWKYNVVLDPSAAGSFSEVATLGESLIGSGADQLKPRIGTPVASGQYHLVFQARADQSDAKVRLYVELGKDNEGDFGNEATFFLTCNARWSGSQWNKDANGWGASKLELSGTDFDFAGKEAGDDSPWDNGSWNVSAVSGSFTSGNVRVGGALHVGGVLEVTGSPGDPSIPAITSYRYTDSGALKRTLLFESPGAGPFAGIPIRVYMVNGTAFYGQGFEFTYNTRWDYGLERWVPDDAFQKSFCWAMVLNRFYFMSKNASGFGTPWTDDPVAGWSRYTVFDHSVAESAVAVKDGVFKVDSATSISNPASAFAVQTNTLYAKNMIKSWGKIRGDGPSTFNVSILDGFNCSLATYDGGAGAYAVYWPVPFSNTHYSVAFSGRATNSGTPPVEPGSYFVWSAPQRYLHSAVLIGQATVGFSYYPLVGQNSGSLPGSLGDIRGHFMYYMAIGAQT